jgi:peptidoglycan/xylan/chitin deacetylase (PgdA/CDA1 family)
MSVPSHDITKKDGSFFRRRTRRAFASILVARKRGVRSLVDLAVLVRSINLTFHGIGDPRRRLDPGEQDVWVSREQFSSLLDCAAGREDVAISFDDGNSSDVEQALPALRERGLTATFFVVAGRLGAQHFLDEDGIRTLATAGMVIGCHGMRHRPWRGLDGRALHEELIDAKAILARAVGRPVTRAACPFGSYDRRVLRTLHAGGYEQVYTSDRGTARHGDFLQPRNSVGPNDEPALLEHIARIGTPTYRGLHRRTKLAIKRWR